MFAHSSLDTALFSCSTLALRMRYLPSQFEFSHVMMSIYPQGLMYSVGNEHKSDQAMKASAAPSRLQTGGAPRGETITVIEPGFRVDIGIDCRQIGVEVVIVKRRCSAHVETPQSGISSTSVVVLTSLVHRWCRTPHLGGLLLGLIGGLCGPGSRHSC